MSKVAWVVGTGLGLGAVVGGVALLVRAQGAEAAPDPTVPPPESDLPLGSDQIAVTRLLALGGIIIGDLEIKDASILPVTLVLGAGYNLSYSITNLSARATVGVQTNVAMQGRFQGRSRLYGGNPAMSIKDPLTNSDVALAPGESVSRSGLVTIERRGDIVPGFPRLVISVLDLEAGVWREFAIGQVP